MHIRIDYYLTLTIWLLLCALKGEDSNSVGRPVSLDLPIDIHLETQSAEGWPVFTFELWSRPSQQMHELLGCGMLWCPSNSGSYDVRLWRPRVPVDIKTLRAYLVRPYSRNQIEVMRLTDLLFDSPLIKKCWLYSCNTYVWFRSLFRLILWESWSWIAL